MALMLGQNNKKSSSFDELFCYFLRIIFYILLFYHLKKFMFMYIIIADIEMLDSCMENKIRYDPMNLVRSGRKQQ